MQRFQATGLTWLDSALGYLGTKEIPGPKHNSLVVRWAQDMSNGLIKDDETAWCGTFVGAMMSEAGLDHNLPSNPLSARSYMELKRELTQPAVGAIAVWWRGHPTNDWRGHVNFIVGQTRKGELVCVGGNQGNAVSLAAYDIHSEKSRLLGYRWPNINPAPSRYALPFIDIASGTVTEA